MKLSLNRFFVVFTRFYYIPSLLLLFCDFRRNAQHFFMKKKTSKCESKSYQNWFRFRNVKIPRWWIDEKTHLLIYFANSMNMSPSDLTLNHSIDKIISSYIECSYTSRYSNNTRHQQRKNLRNTWIFFFSCFFGLFVYFVVSAFYVNKNKTKIRVILSQKSRNSVYVWLFWENFVDKSTLDFEINQNILSYSNDLFKFYSEKWKKDI